jgi:uncharacterized protein
MTEDHQVSGDQQTWRVLAHASAFIQFIGIPSVVGPLIVWLIRREDPVVEPHARAALNFQLSLLIYFVVGSILAFLALVTIIGIPLAALIVIFLLLALLLGASLRSVGHPRRIEGPALLVPAEHGSSEGLRAVWIRGGEGCIRWLTC